MRVGSGVILLVARITEALGPLARSVALAHLISPIDFGIAVSISITAGIGDMVLDFGIQQSAVRQIGRYDDGEVLATLHTLAFLRGFVLCFLLVLGASSISTFLRSSSGSEAFYLLGGTFIIRGCSNLGIVEAARNYSFAPGAKAVLLEQAAQTSVVVAAALIARNYQCMLIGIYASSATYMIASHMLSSRRWQLGWSRDAANEAIRFGAPLIPSGAASALGQVGDRFTIGSLLGPAVLAFYSVTSTAAVLPRNVVIRFLNTLFTPFFVNEHSERSSKASLRDRWTVSLFGTGFFYSLAFIAMGRPLISLVFGQIYEPEQLFVSAVAIGGCLKFFQQYPIPPALAYGDTRFILYISVLNITSLLLGILVLWVSGSLVAFIFGIAVGDFTAVIISIARSVRRYKFGAFLPSMLLIVSNSLLLMAAAVFAQFDAVELFLRMAFLCAFGAFFALILAMWLLMRRSGKLRF
jgi:O-antigen/teichoic acid export membrane protein